MSFLFKKNNSRIKSDLVVMQDWMKFHPETSPTAPYYLRLSNKVLNIILQSDLREDCGSAERAIQLACILTAYFEDVISETSLFRIFTKQHEELYGKPLPFYEVTEEYLPDEINPNDLCFLAWHALSLWGKEDDIGMFDPFFRDGNHVTAISEIYDLFDSEFETAPQNEQMQQFLRLSPRASVDEIRRRLDFLSGKYYLSFIEHAAFMDRLIEETEQRMLDSEAEDVVEAIEEQKIIFYDTTVNYMFNHNASLLARRASEYLACLAGEEHPLYPLLKGISTRKFGSFLFQEEKKTEFIFEHILSGTRINVSKEYFAVKSEQITFDRPGISMGIVKWGDTWQQMGSAVMFDYTPGRDMDVSDASIFDDPEEEKRVLKEKEKNFLQVNRGKRIAYLKGAEELCDLYGRFLDLRLPPTEDKEERIAELLAEIRHPSSSKSRSERMTLFFNPVRGIEFYSEHITTAIADPDNPYYVPGKNCELETLFFSQDVSGEFITYLINSRMVEFVESEKFAPEISVLLDNRDFLLRYYKPQSYRLEP